MAGMESKAGVTSQYADEAVLTSTLDWRIQRTRGEIRVAEELRTVIVRTMSPAAPPAPPLAAQAEAAPVEPPD